MAAPKMDEPLGQLEMVVSPLWLRILDKEKKATEVCAYIKKGEKNLISTSHQSATFMHFLGSRTSVCGTVASEGKHCK